MLTVLAYLDPGSGSMLIQIIVGGIAAAGVSIKLFWRRITGWLPGRKRDEQSAEARSTS